MNKRTLLVLAGTLAAAGAANASTIYIETFANGTALAADPLVNNSAIATYFQYQTGGVGGNGQVLTNSNNDLSTSPGATGDPGVTAGPAGYTSGYFLVEGTGTAATGNNNTFFASSNFTVTAGTTYTVSFDLTNVNAVNPPSPASVTLQVNGVSLLSGVSALGYYGDGNASDNWQTFSATFTAASSGPSSLALIDNNTALIGNDFAVDLIQVASVGASATPEPSTFFLLGGAAIAVGLFRRKRSASAVA